MGMERWRTESPTVETLICGCKIIWHPGTHIPPLLLRCALHRSVSDLLAACKAVAADLGERGRVRPPAMELLIDAIAKAEPKEAPDV